MPSYLAGREKDIQEITDIFTYLKENMDTKSVIYSGLRGVGKTVLINYIEKIAEENNIFCRHIEIEEKQDFIIQLSDCASYYLRQTTVTEPIKILFNKAIEAIKSLVLTVDPNNSTFSVSVQEKQLYRTNSLSQGLTELFVSIGAIAEKKSKPICFFIDEIQYINPLELSAVIVALHRCEQLGYPIMIIGAGLPRVYKLLSDGKSYSERLFYYKEIGYLSEKEATEAIVEPAKKYDVSYTDEAIKKIIEITKGYPYFIQQLCSIVYTNSGNIINEYDVEIAIEEYYSILDQGFYKVRYARCSEMEKKFIKAMVDCGELPCTIANIAKNMQKTVKSISPIRGKLISKGIIFATKYSELDFTVPEFDKYLKRTGGV